MSRLHELVAIEPSLLAAAKAMVEEATVTFTKRGEHFEGQTRAVEYFDEGRSAENESTSKEVVTTVDEKLSYTLEAVRKSLDVVFTREVTNQSAVADLIIDDRVILGGVPIYFLLQLEKRFTEIKSLLLTVPTLDPNLEWVALETDKPGIYRSQELRSNRTERRPSVLTLAPATEKFPAQVKEIVEETTVAKIITIKRSGAYSVADKAALLARCDAIILAVKQARERANSTEVAPRRSITPLLDFLMGA